MTVLRHSVVVRQIPRDCAQMFSETASELAEDPRFDADGAAMDQEAWPGVRLTAGTVVHRLARARLMLAAARQDGEHVRVTVTVRARGRCRGGGRQLEPGVAQAGAAHHSREAG